MKKINLRWRYYWLWLAIYHIVIPYKPLFPYGWLPAYGIAGAYYTFRHFPITFFIAPLAFFIIAKMAVLAINRVNDMKATRTDVS